MAAISKLTSIFKNAISHASAKYYASFEKNLHVNMAFQEPMIILGGGMGGTLVICMLECKLTKSSLFSRMKIFLHQFYTFFYTFI